MNDISIISLTRRRIINIVPIMKAIMGTATAALARSACIFTGASAGLLFVAAIAGLSFWITGMPHFSGWGISPLTLAILLGILLGNSIFPYCAKLCAEGVDFSKSRLLRLGIILYGFQITFQEMMTVGWAGLLIGILIIGMTFSLAVYVGVRFLKLDRETAILIGAGSSICGAAAVLATESVVRGQARQVSIAVATVVLFGTLSMLIYPLMFPYLHMSETAYGIFVGSTIHEVAQVIGASHAISTHAGAIAVIEKMLRVMMLGPFLLVLSHYMSRTHNRRKAQSGFVVPWFALLFIVTGILNSIPVLPPQWVSYIVYIDQFLLAMAMAALGLRTNISAVRQAGLRPLLLAGILFLFLSLGGYVLNRLVGQMLG